MLKNTEEHEVHDNSEKSHNIVYKYPLCSPGNYPKTNGMHKCVECNKPVQAIDGYSYYRNDDEKIIICSDCFIVSKNNMKKTYNLRHFDNIISNVYLSKDSSYEDNANESMTLESVLRLKR